MKKFIFSEFAGLQAYSRQLYYQINSTTGIFNRILSPPHAPPYIDLSPPSPSNFEEPPPLFLKPVGNPGFVVEWGGGP